MNQVLVGTKPELIGKSVTVPLVTGQEARYINLDYAASTPPMVQAVEAITELLPYYSSVHRGAGYKSQVSTAAYEGARAELHRFFGARDDDVVVFVRNTTEALNLLAASLPEDCRVVTFSSEHHANLLSWRRAGRRWVHLPAPDSKAGALEQLEEYLRAYGAGLVAVTGASNVTGEVWPVKEVAALAHSHGARVVLDAAQMAPHMEVSIRELDVDYMAASGHKMYAPFGAGVLIGRPDWLARGEPYLRGGGAVEFVTAEDVFWTGLPDRQEAGSPNVLGAVAMGSAAKELRSYGMARLAAEERQLAAYARDGLKGIPEVTVYRLWEPEAERIGVVTFNVEGWDHGLLATVLSAEYGIGIRHGCFCAHPLMLKLLKVSDAVADSARDQLRRGYRARVPGAVRMSLGLGSCLADVEALLQAVRSLVKDGPRWSYRLDEVTGEYSPSPDPRLPPALPCLLSWQNRASGHIRAPEPRGEEYGEAR